MFQLLLAFSTLAGLAAAQTAPYAYYVKSFAGAFPLGDGGPAASALLYFPNAAVADAAGNLYILDSDNYRIRKVGTDGVISTLATLNTYGYDLKLGAAGALYVGGTDRILRVSPDGVATTVAGTGAEGYSGDGGPALTAKIGVVYGLAIDASGNIFFSDVSAAGHRVREVTADGLIQTVAGTSSAGFNGDRQPATSAMLNYPRGIAVGGDGTVYVADQFNHRVRKFQVGGAITTAVGSGQYGLPLNGFVTYSAASNLQNPYGVYLDSAGNLFLTDTSSSVLLRLTPDGVLSRIAGNFLSFGAPGDGSALDVTLLNPTRISGDASGNIFLVDGMHVVRKITPAGASVTVAGRIHFAGDFGPAAQALLNQPTDIVLDARGNAYIGDSANRMIRKVAPDGTITTFAGKITPGVTFNGGYVDNVQLSYVYALALDRSGLVYFSSYSQLFRIGADGSVAVVAGTGAPGSSGDGGKATAATFQGITGIAIDPSGNVYVADAASNRIRRIAADTGLVTAFAGTGARGRSGDGGPASAAQLNLYSRAPLLLDAAGNLYIADGANLAVRMVSPSGIMSTIIGNGSFGQPDGVPAITAPFSAPGPMAFDASGALYVASQNSADLYRVSNGIIHRISGGGPAAHPPDGTPALAASFFVDGLAVDGKGDVYAVDHGNNTVRKLIVNSPAALAVVDGDQQTGQPGQMLTKQLKVQLTGRAGAPVARVPIDFAVASGAATLLSTAVTTDDNGVAGGALVLGSAAGPVTVTATVHGVTLPPARFTATVSPAAGCGVAQPSINSVRSASDFGGLNTFASGSWVEIKGANLARTTRSWGSDDFAGGAAPTSLDGVSVTIDGKPAFVAYISPAQINVQAPADSTIGPVTVAVSTAACAAASAPAVRSAVAAGLLAPAAFKIAGRQYLAALYPDGATFVGSSGMIPGIPLRPAAPGDVITLYATGLGDLAPGAVPGLAAGSPVTVADLTVTFGSTAAAVLYAGTAPNTIGLFQLNVVVPDVPDGDQFIGVQQGSASIAAGGYLAIRR